MDKTKRYFTSCALVCFLLLLLLAGVWHGGQYYVRHTYIDPELSAKQREYLDRFFTEIVEIPEEWQEAEPFPEALVEASEQLYGNWKHLSDNYYDTLSQTSGEYNERLQEGESLNETEWDLLQNLRQAGTEALDYDR